MRNLQFLEGAWSDLKTVWMDRQTQKFEYEVIEEWRAIIKELEAEIASYEDTLRKSPS